jgi:ATP-dependent helicase/DNAse subunit B
MRLVVGPPGSGKTSLILDCVRGALGRGEAKASLLLPTATMAEHLRNELAREGFVFRPGMVATLSKFVESHIADLPQASGAVLEWMVEAALVSTGCYPSVSGYAGFRKSLVSAIEELATAGARPEHLAGLGLDEFARVYRTVEAEATRRGLWFRSARLRAAAERIGNSSALPAQIFLDGFYSFTPSELEILRALNGRVETTVTLPDFASTLPTLNALRAMNCTEERLEGRAGIGDTQLFSAASVDAEAVEIARRISIEHASGRPFRDIGIIMRDETPYAPALRMAFERFGIPARFHFGQDLRTFAVVRYLSALVEAMLSGWDHALLLDAMLLECSALEADGTAGRFEIALRSGLAGHGLTSIVKYAPRLKELEALSSWSKETASAADWSGRFASLRRFVSLPRIESGVRHERALLWRAESGALAGFEAALTVAASVFEKDRKISCAEYWRALKIAIDSASVRAPDHRRDVVHVMDSYEARQWRLPVVFVCGLIEKQFPKHHSENPVVPNAARAALQNRGFNLRTSMELDDEERFLFDVATSRAGHTLHLSYPRLNQKGVDNLRSFLLDEFRARQKPLDTVAVPIRPAPLTEKPAMSRPSIYDPDLRAVLNQRYARISPTAIENFLQCPYKFFAQHTLKLKGRPADPFSRLDPMTQGSIGHKTLEGVCRNNSELDAVFDAVFEAEQKGRCIPQSYRTEAVRLELYMHLEDLLKSSLLRRGTTSYFEHKFELPLDESAVIAGKIDRLEVDQDGRAIVLDYKYKTEVSLRKDKKAHDEGLLVQGGLYLFAVQSLRKHGIAGMLYCGFRGKPALRGWVTAGGYHDKDSGCSDFALREMINRSKEITLNALVQIREGRIAPAPADRGKCKYCESVAICRVDTAEAQRRVEQAAL